MLKLSLKISVERRNWLLVISRITNRVTGSMNNILSSRLLATKTCSYLDRRYC